MKYLLIFAYFTGGSPIMIKQTLLSQADCDRVSIGIYQIFLPHMIAKGMDRDRAIVLLRDHTRCIPLSGAQDGPMANEP